MEDHIQISPSSHPSCSEIQMASGPNGLRELPTQQPKHEPTCFCPVFLTQEKEPRDVKDPELKAGLFYPSRLRMAVIWLSQTFSGLPFSQLWTSHGARRMAEWGGFVIIKVCDIVKLYLSPLSSYCLRTAFPSPQRQSLHQFTRHGRCLVANPLCMTACVLAHISWTHSQTL